MCQEKPPPHVTLLSSSLRCSELYELSHQILSDRFSNMTRRKVKPKDAFEIFTPPDNEVLATGTQIHVSADNRRFWTEEVDIATRASSPPNEDHDTSTSGPHVQDEEQHLPESSFQSEEFATTFFHTIAGVQVVAKRKRKRYESSVSCNAM